MILRILFLFFITINQAYSQQNKYHFIIQNKANERLPYASLFWFKPAGFSANEAGVITVTVDTPIDSIIVSTIGYKTLHTTLRELQNKNDSFVIILSPQESLLPSVKVFSTKNSGDFGIQEKQTSFISNNYRNLTGVVKVNYPGKICKIESVSIFISKKSAENIPFRIRILSVAENGNPGEDLLRENIIIDSYKLGNWNTFSLNEYNIIVECPIFFIGIEWLNQPQKMSTGALQIGLTDKIREPYSYFQFANREWRPHKFTNQPATENLMIKTKINY
jgi:hypothetical protein